MSRAPRAGDAIRQIAENSGVEGSIVINKVLESKSDSFGFDAQAEELQGSRNGRDH
jgi:chaperonin GroEL (HSP60 family)